MKFSRSAVAVCAAFLMSLASGAAFAGEVKGPPAPPGVPNTNVNYASRYNANSVCAFSGLNDHNVNNGPTDTQTQTPADGPAGAPGHGIPDSPFVNGCRGFSNPYNPPS